MADTFGGLIDKLTTVNLKMWNTQEILYKIRKMSFEQYKKEFFESEDGAKQLWDKLQDATDLNYQRNQLIDELDEKIIDMILDSSKISEFSFKHKYLQKKHKTY